MRRKVSVKAKISLVVGVTPIIDRYTKLQSALGERFLKIRSVPNRLEATRVALKNEGREVEMREQILKAMKTYLSNLSFDVVPHITPEQDEFLLKLAYYTAYMRANTWRTYDEHGRVIDAEVDGTEVPTRIAKQFRHLSKLLAIVRGRVEVTKAELTTIRRVARDTTDPKRQAILDFMQTYSWGVSHRLTDIAGAVDGLYRSSVGNHLQIMEALRILKHGGDDEVPTWMVDQNFVPFAESAYATSPPVPLRNTPDLRLFSNGTPIRVSTPVDEKRLIRIATEYINREEGSVGRILFFSTMLEAGFDENTVIRVLTKEQCWDIRLNSINYHPQVTPDNF
jgi:hypothetical protein